MTYTGFRLSDGHLNRAQELAKQLGVSRNKLIGLLIERAEIKSQPVVNVSLGQNKSAEQTVAGSGAFVGAN
jgi:hypothetical protein